MTEGDWLAREDTWPIFESLRGRVSKRKLRLFACACCRQLSGLDERSWRAIEVTERYADGRARVKELTRAWREAEAVATEINNTADYENRPEDERAYWAAMSATRAAISPDYFGTPREAALDAAYVAALYSARAALSHATRLAQATLFTDILVPRPVSLDPAWLTPNVVDLARTIYDERSFDRLPILADALLDAGCDNADILGHCRSPGPHARGCWVVDLLLGKS